jgi:ABC-type molybdate transport system ATPase subunit
MVAILGPSGAGKSSFLDIVADRRRRGVNGFVGLESMSKRAKKRKDHIQYVLQDENLLPTQTVRETLLFSVCLFALLIVRVVPVVILIVVLIYFCFLSVVVVCFRFALLSVGQASFTC